MSQDTSARLDLPYLAAGQLQKHVTLNEALTRLDVLVQTCVQSRSQTEQPQTPQDGDLYILPPAAMGVDWASLPSGALVRFEAGHWLEVPVFEGLTALVLDDVSLISRVAGQWAEVGGSGAVIDLSQLQQVARFGLNTTADAANPFAARLNKALWTALEIGSGGDGDLRFTFNKEGSGDVLSLLFQSGWQGRAELGLVGDDDLRLKVSPDGSQWHDVFHVERQTGQALFAKGVVRRETTRITASGTWTPPAWAQWVEAICVAGGGGGGSGWGGNDGGNRYGGGGGGAGGVSHAIWPISHLSQALSLSIGEGGNGALASGQEGSPGNDSQISSGAQVLLKAMGGRGGGAGLATNSGTAGAGGFGTALSNGGGASSISQTGAEGQSLQCSYGPGGGGAGGAVNIQNIARAGGAGGAGGALQVPNAGGLNAGQAGGAGGAATAMNWAGGGGAGGSGLHANGGYAGGDGGLYGAGGGGGGGALNIGGRGGKGAAGLIILTAVG